jgi:hypothetical protein
MTGIRGHFLSKQELNGFWKAVGLGGATATEAPLTTARRESKQRDTNLQGIGSRRLAEKGPGGPGAA